MSILYVSDDGSLVFMQVTIFKRKLVNKCRYGTVCK